MTVVSIVIRFLSNLVLLAPFLLVTPVLGVEPFVFVVPNLIRTWDTVIVVCGCVLSATWLTFRATYAKHRPRNDVKQRVQKPADFPPPFPNGWFFVHLSHTLPRGGVASVDALGQQFVVFRGLDGIAAVLDAYCPHLGAHLGEGGTVTHNNCIRCPFHGWEFDAAGTCRKIEGTNIIPPGSNIRSHPCREVNGCIFVWHHAGGVDPQWELDAVPSVQSGYYYQLGYITSYVNTHIREIPENGSDSAHLNVLHKNFVVDALQRTGLYHYWTATWAPHATVKHKSSIALTQEMRLGIRLPFTLVNTVIEQWGPGCVSLWLNTPLGVAHAFEYITPVSPMQQRVTHVMYCSPSIPQPVGKFLLWALDKQFHRDQPIWERKRLVTRPVISKADGPIMEFRRWWSQFYTPESVDMATAIAKDNMMDW